MKKLFLLLVIMNLIIVNLKAESELNREKFIEKANQRVEEISQKLESDGLSDKEIEKISKRKSELTEMINKVNNMSDEEFKTLRKERWKTQSKSKRIKRRKQKNEENSNLSFEEKRMKMKERVNSKLANIDEKISSGEFNDEQIEKLNSRKVKLTERASNLDSMTEEEFNAVKKERRSNIKEKRKEISSNNEKRARYRAMMQNYKQGGFGSRRRNW